MESGDITGSQLVVNAGISVIIKAYLYREGIEGMGVLANHMTIIFRLEEAKKLKWISN